MQVLLLNPEGQTNFCHKLQKLKKQVSFYYPFKADVERLRYYNEVLRESCLVPGEYNTKAYTKQARPVRGYALKENLDTPLKTLCEKMITNELDYLQLLTGRV